MLIDQRPQVQILKQASMKDSVSPIVPCSGLAKHKVVRAEPCNLQASERGLVNKYLTYAKRIYSVCMESAQKNSVYMECADYEAFHFLQTGAESKHQAPKSLQEASKKYVSYRHECAQ